MLLISVSIFCTCRPTITRGAHVQTYATIPRSHSKNGLFRLSLCAVKGCSTFEHLVTGHPTGGSCSHSAAAALGRSRSDWDLLGSWSAKGSERYSRAAKYRITLMRREVSATFLLTDNPDPLAESSSLGIFSDVLKDQGADDVERTRTSRMCSARRYPILLEAEDLQLRDEELRVEEAEQEAVSIVRKLSKEK